MTQEFNLAFLDTSINVSIDHECLDVFTHVLRFIEGYYLISYASSSFPNCSVRIHPFDDSSAQYEPFEEECVFVDGRNEEYTYRARKRTILDDTFLHFGSIQTLAAFHAGSQSVDLYISDRSVDFLIEFIRDYVLKMEEGHGSFELHAAGVVVDGIGIAIMGEKGAGKTSLLLDLCLNQDFTYLSGDKLFLRTAEGDKLMVYGRPEYAHVGLGTILSNTRLHCYFRDLMVHGEPDQETKYFEEFWKLKEALDIKSCYTGVELKAIILPRLSPIGQSKILVERGPLSRDELEQNIAFSIDSRRRTPFWNPLAGSIARRDCAEIYRRIVNCKVFSVLGGRPIEPELVVCLKKNLN